MNNAKTKKNVVFLVAGIIFILIGLLVLQSNQTLAIISIIIGILLILLYFLKFKGTETTVAKASPQQDNNEPSLPKQGKAPEPVAVEKKPAEETTAIPVTKTEALDARQETVSALVAPEVEAVEETTSIPIAEEEETAMLQQEEPLAQATTSLEAEEAIQTQPEVTVKMEADSEETFEAATSTLANEAEEAREAQPEETIKMEADSEEAFEAATSTLANEAEEAKEAEPEETTAAVALSEETFEEAEEAPLRSMPIPEADVILHKIKLIDSEVIQRISKRFVAFDFETTGLSRMDDRVVEIGAVLFEDCKPTERFNTLINPDTDFSTKVIRIKAENFASAPKEEEVFPGFVSFLGDVLDNQTILVAHNADFDASFLAAMLKRHGTSGEITYIDTLRLSRAFIPGLANYKQPTIAKHLGMPMENDQTADIDAEICGNVFLHMMPLIQSHAKEKESLAKDKQPSIAQKGVCAYIAKILKENGRDITRLRFERTENGVILAKHPLPFAGFRISRTKPLSLYFNKDIFIKAEGINTSTDGDTVRARVNSLEEIDLLKETLLKGYDAVSAEIDAFYGDSEKLSQDQESSFTIKDSETASLIAAYNDYRRDKSEKKTRRRKKQ